MNYFLRDVICWIVFLGLIVPASGDPAVPSVVQVLYPVSSQVAVKAPHQHLIGRVDTTVVASVEISSLFDAAEEIKVEPATIRQDFARLVKRLFPESFFITRFEYQSRHAANPRADQTLTAEFPNSERMDLDSFWKAKRFRKIFSTAVRDTTAGRIRVAVQGFVLDSRDVGSESYRKDFGEFFVFRIKLNAGLNDVKLRGLDANRTVLEEQLISYSYKSEIDKKTETPPAFVENRFHTPDQEAVCSGCHRMELDRNEDTRRSAVANACFPCHKWVTEETFVHGPVTSWNCLYCHETLSRDGYRFSIPQDTTIDQLCFECHVTLRAAYQSKTHIHGPVASGSCSLCHNSHSSNEAGLIRLPALELCTTCHGERYAQNHPVVDHPARGVIDPLATNRELSCVSCHAPHYSDSPNLFHSATGVYDLCQQCHNK